MPFVTIDQQCEWARRLVRFPSPQTAEFEREPQVQAFLSGPVIDIIEELGLSWRRDDMGSIIVEMGQEGPGQDLMFMSYAMTHPANRMNDPYEAELLADGSRIRGRGLAEQKGSLTAMLAAASAARDLPLQARLTFVISSAGETGRHDAARATLAEIPHLPQACIICVGTGGKLAYANKGRIDVEIKVRGQAAHSSTPWAGIDAIIGAQRVLERVQAVDLGDLEHPGLGRSTLTATSIRSWPEATHTLQDEVLLVFDRRLLPGEDSVQAFHDIATAAAIEGPWIVETLQGPHMFPAEIDPNGPLASAIAAGCADMGVPQPEGFYSNGALDAGLFHSLGIEAAMWGPGEQSLWHSDNESISLQEIDEGGRAYLGLIKQWCC